jgi:hypothetical protein
MTVRFNIDTTTLQELHRTVFIVERDIKNTNIIFYHYNPYGTYNSERWSGFQGKHLVDSVRPYLVQSFPGYTVEIQERGVSCHRGIQLFLRGGVHLMDDSGHLERGFCQLYTLFWMYHVMELVSDISLDLHEWGSYIDLFYMYKFKDRPEELYTFILRFGYSIIMDYLDSEYNDAQKIFMLQSTVHNEKYSRTVQYSLQTNETGNIKQKQYHMFTIDILYKRLRNGECVHVQHIKTGKLGNVTSVVNDRFGINNGPNVQQPLYWMIKSY